MAPQGSTAPVPIWKVGGDINLIRDSALSKIFPGFEASLIYVYIIMKSILGLSIEEI